MIERDPIPSVPRIRLWQDMDRDSVISLVLTVQNVEYNIGLSLDDQPDLLDVPRYYFMPGGGFWVAVDVSNQVVGCIGLQLHSKHVGVLKKFFVHPSYRGLVKGYSASLFAALLAHSNSHRLEQIILDSPAVATRSHAFYRRVGFRRITPSECPVPYDYVDRNSYLFLLPLGGTGSNS